MKRSRFLALAGAGAVAALTVAHRPAMASWPVVPYTGPSAVIAWNQVLMEAIKTNANAPTVAGRSISMVYEAACNAWAAYGNVASFTLGGLRYRPSAEWTTANKTIAVGYAAYGVLVALYPGQQAMFDVTLAQTLAGLTLSSQQALAARQVGTAAAVALLQARLNDGSNQLGDLTPGAGPYADWTGYAPVNSPDALLNPLRWQPLRVTDTAGATSVQKFVTPHWGQVRPFALPSGAALRPVFAPFAPTEAEIDQLIAFSASLNDAAKAQVDFFANNPGSVTPPGQWTQFAEKVAAIDGNSLDKDVVMFFVLGQAMLDASIACWEAKRYYDSARPYSVIRTRRAGTPIVAWAGPGLGVQQIDGSKWHPYQRATVPSPAFPEFCSGHSTFSAAAAAVIAALRGSDAITLDFTVPVGGVKFESTVNAPVPAVPVVLRWTSLSAAADAAGLSRRLGGIHFEQGDMKGRALGKQVAQKVLAKCVGLVRVPIRTD